MIRITDLKLTASNDKDRRTGLLGWLQLELDGSLVVDGITLRRTLDGRHALSFPTRIDGTGRERPYVRPIDDATRRDLEQQVFERLGLEEHGRRR